MSQEIQQFGSARDARLKGQDCAYMEKTAFANCFNLFAGRFLFPQVLRHCDGALDFFAVICVWNE
jgi:hypothetical protein